MIVCRRRIRNKDNLNDNKSDNNTDLWHWGPKFYDISAEWERIIESGRMPPKEIWKRAIEWNCPRWSMAISKWKTEISKSVTNGHRRIYDVKQANPPRKEWPLFSLCCVRDMRVSLSTFIKGHDICINNPCLSSAEYATWHDHASKSGKVLQIWMLPWNLYRYLPFGWHFCC